VLLTNIYNFKQTREQLDTWTTPYHSSKVWKIIVYFVKLSLYLPASHSISRYALHFSTRDNTAI
jgi:hypothetical protein